MQNWISKKEKKKQPVFQNFGSVGKGHTNIFFWGPHHGFNFHSQFFLTNPLPHSKMVGRHECTVCTISNWLHQCRGGGAFNFFQMGVCGPDFRSVGLANWYLPLKEGACELKISKFGGLWTEDFQIWGLWAENFQIWGLRANIWAKVETAEVKISNFSQQGVLWTDTDSCKLQKRRETGVVRAAHPHTPFLGQCPPSNAVLLSWCMCMHVRTFLLHVCVYALWDLRLRVDRASSKMCVDITANLKSNIL